LIGSTGNGIPYSEAVSDGSGGAIVMWWECLPQVPGEPTSCQIYAARIDPEGNVEWERDITGVDQVISDGSGGVIIVYSASVLKVDAEGNLPWGEDGVSLSLPDAYLCSIASDGSGGVIVAQDIYGEDIICAQRVDSQGNILWGSGGAQVFVSPVEGADVVSDGAGGAIIAYIRDIPCEDGKYGSCGLDIYAQRIEAEGSVLWGPDGVPICTESAVVQHTQIVDDGAGGAIVFFVTHLPIGDYASPAIHALRIDADGHKLWPEDIVLWPTANHSLVSDGSGGGISVWYGDDGIGAGAQRLDAAGRKLWGPDGTPLTLRDLHSSLAVPDGCGGVLISWWSVKSTGYEVTQVSYYVQRVDPEGNVVWGDDGILLNP